MNTSPSLRTLVPLLVALAASLALTACRQEPEDARSGFALSGESSPLPAEFGEARWDFIASDEELWLETRPWWGRHSVTLWFITVDGRLFLATTNRTEAAPYWARTLSDQPKARIEIQGRRYEVEVLPVRDPETWRRAMVDFERKYREMDFARYDYPPPDDMSLGSLYELVPRPADE